MGRGLHAQLRRRHAALLGLGTRHIGFDIAWCAGIDTQMGVLPGQQYGVQAYTGFAEAISVGLAQPQCSKALRIGLKVEDFVDECLENCPLNSGILEEVLSLGTALTNEVGPRGRRDIDDPSRRLNQRNEGVANAFYSQSVNIDDGLHIIGSQANAGIIDYAIERRGIQSILVDHVVTRK